jgi:hypothetical protein
MPQSPVTASNEWSGPSARRALWAMFGHRRSRAFTVGCNQNTTSKAFDGFTLETGRPGLELVRPRQMAVVFGQWPTDDAERWDDGNVSRGSAREAARALRERVNGYESVLSGMDAPEAMQRRKSHAAMYYDLHRAERLNASFRQEHSRHIGTRDLARLLVYGSYSTLTECIAHGGPHMTQSDLLREYMLWRHSLHSEADVGKLPRVEEQLRLFELGVRRPNVEALSAIDDLICKVFGQHTRSPQAVRFGLLRQCYGQPLKWFNSPEGDIATSFDAGAIVEAMSRSLVDRHFEPSLRRFNRGQRARGAADLSFVSLAEGDEDAIEPGGEANRGDYRAEFAHAIAHGVLGRSSHAGSTDCVSDRAVLVAGNSLGISPLVPLECFRRGRETGDVNWQSLRSMPGVSSTYPLEGATLDSRFEVFMPTETVGQYRDALRRIDDPGAPPGWPNYLCQRVPAAGALDGLPPSLAIDSRGRVQG